jgi:predicted kinase
MASEYEEWVAAGRQVIADAGLCRHADCAEADEAARDFIALIAERTKEATLAQIAAVKAIPDTPRPDLSDDGVIGFGWTKLHRASALWPPAGDGKDEVRG